MGCDIHMLVERRICGRWIGVQPMRMISTALYVSECGMAWPVATRRNYERFAKLAGVRSGSENPDSEPKPRGLPDDLSDLGRLEVARMAGDGHSHSWLPLAEATKIFVETENYGSPAVLDPTSYQAMYPMAYYFCTDEEMEYPESERTERYKQRYGEPDDYRLVFWFDN